jgi:hypothetical protein
MALANRICEPIQHWQPPMTCGICGSRAIRYRDKYSGEAWCQKCTDKYVHDWYLAKNTRPVCEPA